MNLNKIDPTLFDYVGTQNSNHEKIYCLVFASNFAKAKKYLQNIHICDRILEYPFINAFGVDIPFSGLEQLASFKHVNYITAQTKVFAQMHVAKKVIGLDADLAEKHTGDRVTMAIIDTGVNPHLDFVFPKNRILLFKDFIAGKTEPYDDNGHGTFVCGVAAGNGICSGGKFSGIAKNANLIVLKALDKNGETGAFNILEAMQWVFDNAKIYNIRVVCMSFGSQPLNNGDPLLLGAEALWNAGVVVVAAAGNSGPHQHTIKSPGTSNKIITVGAIDDHRTEQDSFDKKKFEIADFSSRGPVLNYYKPDCVAPGVEINSTGVKTEYVKMSGTSVATPIVAGVCALLVEKYPQIKPMELKSVLMNGCTKIINNRNAEGMGLIDCKKLL